MNWADFLRRIDPASLPDAYFVFGIHKCGSTMMHNMVRGVCDASKIPCLDLPGVCFAEGLRPQEWGSDRALVPVFQLRKLFLGFRFFPQILSDPTINIRDKKFVLLVRDPRDALVSQYFSFAGKHPSHALPPKGAEAILSQRRKHADLDIDDYVIKMAVRHLQQMIIYREGLDFNNGLIRHYEDVYFDKRVFLKEVFQFFSLPVNEQLLTRVAKAHDVRPDREDTLKHIRKGEPGDHIGKLRADTIHRLNEVFADTAAVFGYNLK